MKSHTLDDSRISKSMENKVDERLLGWGNGGQVTSDSLTCEGWEKVVTNVMVSPNCSLQDGPF